MNVRRESIYNEYPNASGNLCDGVLAVEIGDEMEATITNYSH
jgi:hypothetical protein